MGGPVQEQTARRTTVRSTWQGLSLSWIPGTTKQSADCVARVRASTRRGRAAPGGDSSALASVGSTAHMLRSEVSFRTIAGGLTYRPRTMSRPASSNLIFAGEIRPTRSSRSARSRATTCDTFATESFGKPVIPMANSTFPGASSHRRLLVSGTQTTVASRLRFKASPWTTTTGRRNPGPEPVGSGNSAQHTSPWAITNRRDRAPAVPRRRGSRLRSRQPRRIRGSSCR